MVQDVGTLCMELSSGPFIRSGILEQAVGRFYGTTPAEAGDILEAYEQSGEIAPKLLRRFGITEGNRQTLLLGMFMSQLVNPYKYTIIRDFMRVAGRRARS